MSQPSGLAAAAAKGVPNQAALGTAGRHHQAPSSSNAVGLPPGLGLGPPQQGGVKAGDPQQAAANDQQANGQAMQVSRLYHVGMTDLVLCI